jgi:hypothetical protein
MQELACAGIHTLTSDVQLLEPMRESNKPPLRKLLLVVGTSKHDFAHDVLLFLNRQEHGHIGQRLTAVVNVQRTIISRPYKCGLSHKSSTNPSAHAQCILHSIKTIISIAIRVLVRNIQTLEPPCRQTSSPATELPRIPISISYLARKL